MSSNFPLKVAVISFLSMAAIILIPVQFIFYPFWGLGEVPGALRFAFTHLGWPNQQYYATWLPCVDLAGSVCWMVALTLLMFAGMHLAGMMWLFAAACRVTAAVINIYAGTMPGNFSINLIEGAAWLLFCSFGLIIIGAFCGIIWGVRPREGVRNGGCMAFCCPKGDEERRWRVKKSIDGGHCCKIGYPCSCPSDCPKSCGSTWIGDNKFLYWIWGVLFAGGLAVYLLGTAFYAFWAVAQFDPSSRIFAWTHQSWPTQYFLMKPFVPWMLISGMIALFIDACIIFIGGLHGQGFFAVLGTGFLLSAHVLQYIYGTDGDYDLSHLETSMWFQVVGFISIVFAFVGMLAFGFEPHGSLKSLKEKLKSRRSGNAADDDASARRPINSA